jgi:hypothetical protein
MKIRFSLGCFTGAAAGEASSIQSCQPGGAGPHAGSGCQSGGGLQFRGGCGQFGGGLKILVIAWPLQRRLLPDAC